MNKFFTHPSGQAARVEHLIIFISFLTFVTISICIDIQVSSEEDKEFINLETNLKNKNSGDHFVENLNKVTKPSKDCSYESNKRLGYNQTFINNHPIRFQNLSQLQNIMKMKLPYKDFINYIYVNQSLYSQKDHNSTWRNCKNPNNNKANCDRHHHCKRRRHSNSHHVCSPIISCTSDEIKADDNCLHSCYQKTNNHSVLLTSSQCKLAGTYEEEDVHIAAIDHSNSMQEICEQHKDSCKPQPEIIYIRQHCLLNGHYIYQPPFTVRYKCLPSSICCIHSDFYKIYKCIPKIGAIQNISQQFVVYRTSGVLLDEHSLETLTFENHTECECTLLKVNNNNNNDLVKPLNDDHDKIGDTTTLIPNIEIEEKFSGDSSLINKKIKKRPKICYRCPRPFICKKKRSQRKCICRCDPNDLDCKLIASGIKEILLREKNCILNKKCLNPKCSKRKKYDKASGYCV